MCVFAFWPQTCAYLARPRNGDGRVTECIRSLFHVSEALTQGFCGQHQSLLEWVFAYATYGKTYAELRREHRHMHLSFDAEMCFLHVSREVCLLMSGRRNTSVRRISSENEAIPHISHTMCTYIYNYTLMSVRLLQNERERASLLYFPVAQGPWNASGLLEVRPGSSAAQGQRLLV